ncbi:hypothetical protein NL676_026690 [Syzygium grande]|nr:hypothetical protein NL676_026690 [Syzygium grande]
MITQCLGAISGVGLVKASTKPHHISLGGDANSMVSCFNMGVPLGAEVIVLMVHLATIPIIGTGINPARSFGATTTAKSELTR